MDASLVEPLPEGWRNQTFERARQARDRALWTEGQFRAFCYALRDASQLLSDVGRREALEHARLAGLPPPRSDRCAVEGCLLLAGSERLWCGVHLPRVEAPPSGEERQAERERELLDMKESWESDLEARRPDYVRGLREGARDEGEDESD